MSEPFRIEVSAYCRDALQRGAQGPERWAAVRKDRQVLDGRGPTVWFSRAEVPRSSHCSNPKTEEDPMKLTFDQYPTGMLHNTATNRYHPIVFRPAPSASDGCGPTRAFRYRSKGHHTVGFDTKEEAMQDIAKQPAFVWSGLEWAWDGADVPAMTWWFTIDDEQPQEAAAS